MEKQGLSEEQEKARVKKEIRFFKNIDVMRARDKLSEQKENYKLRIEKIQNNVTRLKADSIARKNEKDSLGAIAALRRARFYEKELKRLEAQEAILEKQKMMLEGDDLSAFAGLQELEMDQLIKQMKINSIISNVDQQIKINQDAYNHLNYIEHLVLLYQEENADIYFTPEQMEEIQQFLI